MSTFDDQTIVITGGTGSLGKTLVRHLLSGSDGRPRKIIVFSRDEAKQHQMRVEYLHKRSSTDEIIYRNFERLLEFRIGDVRNPDAVVNALRDADIVFNAAAMKQVPTCEYFPDEAVRTNITGAENIVRAIRDFRIPVKTVVGISTDKAVQPVNVMGMTKAIQERVFIRANLECPNTRFCAVRYGNVLASRGSVIPLFHEQIRSGGPVTITSKEMTRFLLSLDEAVAVIFAAVRDAGRGETYVPRALSARIVDVAAELIGDRPIEMRIVGVRPGEKLHESLVSAEEAERTHRRGDYYVIDPILPELRASGDRGPKLDHEFVSSDGVASRAEVCDLLIRRKLMLDQVLELEGEILR